MKRFPLFFLIALAAAGLFAAAPPSADGIWAGSARRGAQEIPFRLEIRTVDGRVQAAFLNGPERSPASAASYSGGHLLLRFDDYLNQFDATVDGDTLTGTFGGHARGVPVSAQRVGEKAPAAARGPRPPRIDGDWEVALPKRPKGEQAWKLEVRQNGLQTSAVILRIDGDTGKFYGGFGDGAFHLARFTSDGPSAITLTPQPDGTLALNQGGGGGRAAAPLIARRYLQARAAELPTPDDPLHHTTLADPMQPLAFRFPDIDGHVVANTDARFAGKVVIVAIGGSWCPNCHDEAPFLEALYRKYRARGLEIVALDFEEAAQLQNPTRLRAFVRQYGIEYPVLLAGEPSQLNAILPQARDLNCWPTTFFIGRDGLVKAIHAGFASPATSENAALRTETDVLLRGLLAKRTEAAAAAAAAPAPLP